MNQQQRADYIEKYIYPPLDTGKPKRLLAALDRLADVDAQNIISDMPDIHSLYALLNLLEDALKNDHAHRTIEDVLPASLPVYSTDAPDCDAASWDKDYMIIHTPTATTKWTMIKRKAAPAMTSTTRARIIEFCHRGGIIDITDDMTAEALDAGITREALYLDDYGKEDFYRRFYWLRNLLRGMKKKITPA